MRSVVLATLLLAIIAAVAFAQEPAPDPPLPTPTPTATATPEATLGPTLPPDFALITWKHSTALGKPARKGRLVDGVQLPELAASPTARGAATGPTA
jgi:hypothetical protein